MIKQYDQSISIPKNTGVPVAPQSAQSAPSTQRPYNPPMSSPSPFDREPDFSLEKEGVEIFIPSSDAAAAGQAARDAFKRVEGIKAVAYTEAKRLEDLKGYIAALSTPACPEADLTPSQYQDFMGAKCKV